MSNSAVEPSVPTLSLLHWQQVMRALEGRIKPHNFDMWLRPIVCEAIQGTEIHLRAPNRYIKEWFEMNYLPVVRQELRAHCPAELDISIAYNNVELPPPSPEPEPVVQEAITSSEVSIVPAWDINTRYDFDSFVVGPSNQLAYAAAHAVANLPASKYNPLFIYGGVGLGKTHLLCAIGNEIARRQPQARILYLSSEFFMNDYINHLRANRMEDFRARYRNQCDVLLMDDIQFIAGKDRTQDEFFHTFNSLYDLNRQIVVTSDKYPNEIPELEERLRTRFQWGLIADIQKPDLETRLAILKKKAEGENIALNDDVALFLADRIRSNVRELEGSLIRLAAVASLQHAEIDVPFAERTLRNLIGLSTPTLTIDSVQREVAAYFNVKLADLKSPKRHKAVAWPRQVAMYLARKLTTASFPEIGNRFGGKDHSTVISACRKVDQLLESDLSVRTAVETLERQLRQR